MRIRPLLLTLFATAHAALAQPTKGQRDTALDNLLSERDSVKALDAAIEEARKQGIGEQAVLEARFLFHVDRNEDKAIAAMLPEFKKRRDGFKIEDSAIFSVKEDWLAVVEYVEALDAIGKGDKDSFKHHITEAFWLSPNQASAFAPHVERLRLEESMRAIKVDFSLKLAPVHPGDPVELDKLMQGKKAVLFHFWSPMSTECEASMPDFSTTAALLETNGVAVVSLVPDGSEKLMDDARAMIRKLGEKPPGAWLVDAKDKALARDFRVRDIPVMVLVSTEGKVLFNGDPTDDGFWNALKKINEHIARPQSSLQLEGGNHGE